MKGKKLTVNFIADTHREHRKDEIEAAIAMMSNRRAWGVAEPHVLEAVGSPTEANQIATAVRLYGCPHMGACLNVAAKKKWAAMTCLSCNIYRQA